MARKLLAASFALLFLLSLSFADQLADELAKFDSSLDAKITVDTPPLMKSPSTIKVNAVAKNGYESAMSLYVLRQREGGWEIARLLGALAPSAQTPIELDIEVAYQKATKKETKYAIVGRGADGRVYGKFFEISEDWSPYEKNVRDDLSNSIVTWVPIIAALMIILIIAAARFAYTSKSEGVVPGEFTMRSLVFPEVEGRPFEEKLADILIHPFTIAFELLCVLLLVIVMFDTVAKSFGLDEGAKLMLLSGVGALAVPLLYFIAAWFFEKREEGTPLRFFAGMFAWGMFAAFLSLLASSALISVMSQYEALPFVIMTTMLIAPVVEETLKGMGVLFISGHHEFNDTLTGLLMGFTCGVGFAFVENWFYFAFRANPFDMGLLSWGALVFYRSFFNTLAHGFFTASVSIGVGYCKSVPSLKRFARLAIAPGIFLAITLHMIYNLSALADTYVIASQTVPFYVFNPMLTILLATIFFLVLVFATIDEKKRKAIAEGGGQYAAPRRA